MHLRRLVEPGVGKPPELGPRKQTNAANDIRHWAEAIGVRVSPDARALYKTDTSLALRCALIAKDQGKFREFHYPAYRARWARRATSAQESCSSELLAARASTPTPCSRARARPSSRSASRARRRAAIARGVFGVPTIFVGDEMFWGNDRFELVRFYVAEGRAELRERRCSR